MSDKDDLSIQIQSVSASEAGSYAPKETRCMGLIYSNSEWTEISKVRNAIQRSYEPFQIYFFTQLAEYMGCRSFWDIGANIGSYSVAMARLSNIERVHAFEPMPRLHSELETNVSRNDALGKIVLHQTALSDEDALVEFSVLGDYSGASGVAATLPHDHHGKTQSMNIQAQTLNSVVSSGYNPPEGLCCLKIDVEGHEMSVLVGATDMLRNPCVLQIEVSEQDGKPSSVDEFLADRGYHKFWQIGADRYYAPEKLCPSSHTLLQIVARALEAMIADLRQLEIPGLNPVAAGITRRFGFVQITLLNPAARWVRRLFRSQ